MSDDEKKKDRKFIVYLCVTALIGGIVICVSQLFMMLIFYVLCMAISIPTLYFNYSLCRWENRWHSFWNERNACDGEPSDFRLTVAKAAEWFLFILGLAVSLICLAIASW